MAFDVELAGRPAAAKSRTLWHLWVLNLLAVVVLVTLDWITTGVVVGILLSLPILLSSTGDDPRVIWITGAVATVGFGMAALFGRGPIAPPYVWVPNRILTLCTLPASCAIALLLQRKRLEAARARDAALDASDMNRLLMSLLAHDVRSPLAMAVQTLEYVEGAGHASEPLDESLVRDVQARLRRNLASLDTLLAFAREDAADAAPPEPPPPLDVASTLAAELRAFEPEARLRGKKLVPELSELENGSYAVDPRVLKQALAIVLDNAVRYAAPGTITVSAAADTAAVLIQVKDEGPAFEPSGLHAESGRSGLGLLLCEALLRKAGGRLYRSGNDRNGTTFLIRLPVGAADTNAR